MKELRFTRKNLSWIFLALVLLAVTGCTPYTQTVDEISADPSITSASSPTTLAPTNTSPPPTETATPKPTATTLPHSVWGSATSLRQSRSEMPAVYLDGRIYAISGLASGGALPVQKTSEMYDIANDVWLPMATLPEARHHGMAVAYNGNIYYFGGSPVASLGGMKEAWVYNPTLDKWNEIAPLPIHRSAGAAVVYNEFIYIMGGVGFSHGSEGEEAEDYGETLRYDPARDEWALLAPPLEKREHTSAALVDDKIYLFGGRWEAELKTSEIYDPATDTWTRGPELPEPRAGHGIAVLNNLVYLVGGEIWISGPEETLKSIDVYDPTTNSWSSIPDLPIPLHGVPAVAVDNTLYVIAGSTVAATATNTNRLLIFRP